jgi:hypothetical protein
VNDDTGEDDNGIVVVVVVDGNDSSLDAAVAARTKLVID